MPTPTEQRVYDHRMSADGLTAAKQLFWTELNYDRVNERLSTRDWPERVGEAAGES